MEEKESLYFIAIIPPEPHKSEVTSIKQHFAENYKSKAALKSPPHITLQMPFKKKDKDINEIFETMTSFTSEKEAFPVEVQGYDCFRPRVIFLNIEKNESLLRLQYELSRELQTRHGIFHSTHKNNGFHPHMTVAFRDLKPAQFKLAWEVFKDKKMHFSFLVNKLTLLKHNGRFWEEYKEFFFRKADL